MQPAPPRSAKVQAWQRPSASTSAKPAGTSRCYESVAAPSTSLKQPPWGQSEATMSPTIGAIPTEVDGRPDLA